MRIGTHLTRSMGTIVLIALLGVLTSWLVAACLGAFLPHRGLWGSGRVHMAESASGPRLFSLYRFGRAGMERRTWKAYSFNENEDTAPSSAPGARLDSRSAWSGRGSRDSGPGPGLDDSDDLTSEWGRLGAAARGGILPAGDVIEDARGWPCLAMWCEIKHAPVHGDPVVVSGGLRVPTSGTGLGDARCVPLRPIWTGFLLDTAFYGAIWGMLLVGVPAGKRAARRKVGRCVRCGYDLQHHLAAGCPECGWNKDPKLPT